MALALLAAITPSPAGPVPAPLMTWAPLLEGEAAARALAAAEAIARDLAQASGPGLGRGHAGLALLSPISNVARPRRAGERPAPSQARHRRAVGAAGPSPSLYFGFTGVAWVIEHLTADESGRGRRSREIDAALLSRWGAPRGRGSTTCGGLVGLGVYALERLPRAPAAAMVPLLVARLSERIGGERASSPRAIRGWPTAPPA